MKMKYSRNSSYIRMILFFVVVIVTIILFENKALTQVTDRLLSDQLKRFLTLDQKVHDIVIIDIDDQSIQNVGSWPWSREVLSHLVGRIFENHNPKGLLVDMVLPETRDSKGDKKLQELLQKYPICLAIAFDLEAGNSAREVGWLSGGKKQLYSAVEAIGYIGNNQLLADGARCVGHITPWVDEDGVIRRLPRYISYGDKQWMTISLSLYQMVNGESAGFENSRWEDVPYRYELDSWTGVPAQDIVFESLPEGALDDKYLLIGSSALGLSDRVSSPIHPWLPGVVIHAELLNKYLNPKQTYEWAGPLLSLSYALMSVLVIGLLFWVSQTVWVLAAFLILSLGWVIFTSIIIYSNVLLPWSLPLLAMSLILMVQLPFEWLFVNRYSQRVTRLFKGYLSNDVVNQLIDSQKEVLEPSVRQITVLFADIEGFTKLSTQISTQELAKITRQVLNILTNEVHAFEGTLDKYIGDAAMAIWNAPLDQRNHAELAVKSAISMVKKLEKYNLENPNQPTIQVRIGIHSGDAMVGDLGTKLRHTYTAIGDSVNIAHRLHEKSKDYGSFILISKDVFSQLENPLEESERIIRVAN